MRRTRPGSPLFPYTTLFRSTIRAPLSSGKTVTFTGLLLSEEYFSALEITLRRATVSRNALKYRSEEHTSELQSRRDLVCRLLLEKKKSRRSATPTSTTSSTR